MNILSRLALFFLLFSVACNNGSEKINSNETTLIKGGKTYGGELIFSNPEPIKGLFPLAAANQQVINVSNQIYETLLNIDPTTLNIIPNIATDFKVNEAGTVYTFTIRKGIYFHNDPCFENKTRELSPADIKYALDFACSGNALNQDNNVLIDKIVGASEYKEKSVNAFPEGGVSGIKVNGQTVEITLVKPFVGFEALLARKNIVIFPKEAYQKYGDDILTHPVGTGPFKLEKISTEGIRLVRNDNYWQKDNFGNQLPYLSAISLKYYTEKKDEMLAFRAEEIDLLLDIPADEIENVLGTLQDAMAGKNVKHNVMSSGSLSIDYLGFNASEGVFKSPEVRQAFYFAVDPLKLIDTYVGGDGNPPNNGFVPFIEQSHNKMTVPAANQELAKKLLRKAGYPNGNGFPSTTIYVNGVKGSKNEALINGYIQLIHDVLNIDLKLKLCTLPEREAAIKSGDAKIWKAGWVADYPNPISFLDLFYAHDNKANNFNYNSEVYNSYYKAAQVEMNPKKRSTLYIQAQTKIIEDAVVIPLSSDNMLFMVNARVRGLQANPLEEINFKEVYIKERKKR